MASITAVTQARPTLGLVVPCFNEEAVLPETAKRLTALLRGLVESGKVAPESAIHFVDDGSTDRTWQIIETLCRQGPSVHGIKLSRNCGHQNALLAGLLTAQGDAIVSLDADLQDDVGVVEQMVDEARAGAAIVYGVRRARGADSVFKRTTASAFYTLMQWLGAESLRNHADCRLMSRRALNGLGQFREVNLFLRGLVPLIGFKSSVVYYDRAPRFAGTTKYPLRKMLAFAIEGVTSFSVAPLRLVTWVGLVVFLGSLALMAWALWQRLRGSFVPGWASTVLPLYFLGGAQIFCLGVIGEYVGKIYREAKGRPRYIIDEII